MCVYVAVLATTSDKHRSGRKRITDENTNINIVLTAIEEKFTTPKKIRCELELPASSHSVMSLVLQCTTRTTTKSSCIQQLVS